MLLSIIESFIIVVCFLVIINSFLCINIVILTSRTFSLCSINSVIGVIIVKFIYWGYSSSVFLNLSFSYQFIWVRLFTFLNFFEFYFFWFLYFRLGNFSTTLFYWFFCGFLFFYVWKIIIKKLIPANSFRRLSLKASS